MTLQKTVVFSNFWKCIVLIIVDFPLIFKVGKSFSKHPAREGHIGLRSQSTTWTKFDFGTFSISLFEIAALFKTNGGNSSEFTRTISKTEL